MNAQQESTGPKYPGIVVKLIGTDGNAFAVMSAVTKALRKAGLGDEVVTAFMAEATAGDYNDLLTTCIDWVTVK